MRTLFALICHNFRCFFAQPAYVIAVLLPPILFLLVEFAASEAIQYSPVALVDLDHGSQGQQMQQIFHQADVFRITDTTPNQARLLFADLRVAAIITIPANFSQHVQHHQRVAVGVEINNLNDDFSNDIRRSVPDAITQFYSAQRSQTLHIKVDEHDLRHRDIQIFEYAVVPTLLLILLIAGLVSTASGVAREWERATIKELLLAPMSSEMRLAGNIASGTLIAMSVGLLEVALATMLGWIAPQGIYWWSCLAFLFLVALLGATLGEIIGTCMQRIQSAHAIAMNLAMYLFFLSGGIGVLAFEPLWIQSIATYIPLSYANHALLMAVFYGSSDHLARDLFVCTLPVFLLLLFGWWAQRVLGENFEGSF